MTTVQRRKAEGQSQSERFIAAARELGNDDDPERFKETVRKLAKAPPVRNEPSKAKKRP